MDLNQIPKLRASASKQFFLIAGPCAIEGRQMAFDIAGVTGLAGRIIGDDTLVVFEFAESVLFALWRFLTISFSTLTVMT